MTLTGICGEFDGLLDAERWNMDARQCRAARGLLDWTQVDLSREAGVSAFTIRNFEKGATVPQPATLRVLWLAFDAAGVDFIDGDEPGVRMRKEQQ